VTTLGELGHMVIGRRRDEWDRAANLMALIANVNRDAKKTNPFNAEDFNPMSPKEERSPQEKNAILKGKFETMRARAFGGKVKYIRPFIPANAKA
jgi:hypothetical protein